MLEWILFIMGVTVGILFTHLYFKHRISLEVEKKIREREEKIKRDVLEKSRAVIKGKIAEQIVSLLPEFDFNPADARFIGSPVDYIIFDGYTKVKDENGKDMKIVFLEVKKGEKAELSRIEKAVREAVEKKRVEWRELRLD